VREWHDEEDLSISIPQSRSNLQIRFYIGKICGGEFGDFVCNQLAQHSHDCHQDKLKMSVRPTCELTQEAMMM